jgi:glycosyltransferase involved in cell wall biosynthesis
VNTEKEDGLYGEIMNRSKPLEGKYDVTVQIQLPHEWDPNLGRYNIGVTAGVETDRCSVEWATTHREKMNLVVVPSFHARSTFLTSGTGKERTPIVVVPESYFKELLKDPTDQPFEFSTSKNFLTVGMFTAEDPDHDRKNVINTVKWFCQEFDGKKDVGLIVKTSKGRETTIDRELVRKSLHQVVAQSGCKNPPKIYMLHGSMTRDEMNALYKHPSLLGLVTATRGEGFGLPMLEAAVSGLPVVGTNWSSIIEFLKGDSFLGVDYDLVSVPDQKADGNIFVRSVKWANPKESNFKRKLRKLYEDSDKFKSSAKELSKILTVSHSPESINKKYDEAFSGAL